MEKFGPDLGQELYPLSLVKDKYTKEEALLLMRILKIEVLCTTKGEENISNVKLKEEERLIIKKNGWLKSHNLEVRCRCKDLMMRYQEGNKRPYYQSLSNDYLKLFGKTHKPDYLIRSLAIRNFGHLSCDNSYIHQVQDSYTKIIPACLKDVTKEISKLFPDGDKKQLISYLYNLQEKIDYQKNPVDDERYYIEALHELGYYCNEEEYNYQLAISFERTADYYIDLFQKDSSTFHLVVDWLNKSYHNIYKIKDHYHTDFLRIQKKYNDQLFLKNKLIGRIGIPMPSPIGKDLQEDILKSLSGKNRDEVFAELLNFPFPNEEDVKEIENKMKDSSPYKEFPSSTYSNNEGKTVGISKGIEAIEDIIYRTFRHQMVYTICIYLEYIHFLDDPNFPKILFLLMEKKKPDFIEQDKLPLWIRGIISGLNRDWDLVIYMLTPLIERALHNIAEQRCGEDLSQLQNDLQLEYMLGKDLEKLNGKMEEGARKELISFLIKGSGENLRNKLAHGLLEEKEIILWGPYLWWIALKIYFKKI